MFKVSKLQFFVIFGYNNTTNITTTLITSKQSINHKRLNIETNPAPHTLPNTVKHLSHPKTLKQTNIPNKLQNTPKKYEISNIPPSTIKYL